MNELRVWRAGEGKCVICRYGQWAGVEECHLAHNRALCDPEGTVQWSIQVAPGAPGLFAGPRKCFILFGGQLHGSVCLPLPFDWPGMLERGMSTDCFEQSLASYQLGGLFIAGEAGQSQQREPGANSGSGNVQEQSSKQTSIYTAPPSFHEVLQIVTEYSSLQCHLNQWLLQSRVNPAEPEWAP